jgi:MoxR-like ATPase
MLPADVTGTSIYNQKTSDFEFRPGPIMAQVVLADEINRATPKTQAALLEAMEERQVTVDGVTRALTQPFIVLATQNPIEYEGTFPLPEAQLDRFLMRLALGYPTPEQQMAILDAQQYAHPIETLEQIAAPDELVQMQEQLRNVYADPLIKQYIVEIVEKTRTHSDVYLGASPRGALTLYRASQARAALQGRDYVIPDDVKALALPTLGHRIIIGPAARIKGISSETIVDELLKTIAVPGAKVK